MRSMIGLFALVAAAGAVPIPARAQTIDWRTCSVDRAGRQLPAQCALVPMPLDRSDPGRGTIGIQVKRHLAPADAGVRTQLWFLNGGPGDSGTEALGRLLDALPELPIDVYTLDHRGVGGSALLSCPEQQSHTSPGKAEILPEEWPACIEYLRGHRHDLDRLTTTASARDVVELIARMRQPGKRVVLFGASYGTWWANRTLQVIDTPPDAVILDGIVPPDWTFAEFDRDLAITATHLLQRCGADSVCSRHLGPAPVRLARALPGRFDAGHCSDLGIDGATERLLLGNMLMGGREIWPLIPPLIHRLDRCRLRDLLAIGEMFERLFERGNLGKERSSHAPVLQRHVALSEMWPEPSPSVQELAQTVASAAMSTGVSVSFARTWPSWPRYERDPLVGHYAPYAGPMLMLHGDLDPTMPPDRLASLRAHYSGLHQTFVLVPEAGHVVLRQGGCVRALYRAFLSDPTAPLDTRCLATMPRLQFTGVGLEPAFGTNDLWGDHLTTLEKVLLGAAAMLAGLLVLTLRWWLRRRAQRRVSRPA